jgi:hypothetical protein
MIYTHAAALLAGVAIGATSAWQVQTWRQGHAERARLEHEAEVQRHRARVADTAAAGHEADRAELRTAFRTIYSEVERVVEKPIYRNVCFDTDGLRALDAAIGGAAPGESPGAVPPAGGTD